MLKSLLLSSLVLNFGLLLGRLSGFIRESLVGSAYGVGQEADIVVLMLTVPDVLVNILMGGALGAVLIPEFTKAPTQARRLLFQSTSFFGFLFFVLAVCLYFNMDLLITLLAPGFNDAQHDRSIAVIRWVIWLVPLTVMAGAATAFLQAKDKYAVPAMGTLIVNGSIIAGLVFIMKTDGDLYVLSLFILLGGGLRLISQFVNIGNITLSPLKSLKPLLIHKTLIVRYMQSMTSGSTLLLFPVFARSQATYLGDGNVAILNYATKLIEFPMALTVTFLSVVLLPKLSKSYFEDAGLHTKTVKYGTQATLALSIFAACALSAISLAYASVVFGYGKITPEDIASIANLASMGMLLLPLMGLSTYLTAVYNSRQKTFTPLIVNLSGLIAFILIFKSGAYGHDLAAIMLSMISGYAFISVILITFLKVEGIKWFSVLFEMKFFFGILLGSILTYTACRYIQNLTIASWGIILLAALSSLLFLVITALLNNELRERLTIKIRNL